MTTFKIPTYRLFSFNEAIAKLNKTCAKLGKPAVTAVQTGTEMKVISKEDENGFVLETYTIELAVVEVAGVAPVIDGWSFRSLLSIEAGDKYIRSVPGFNLPVAFRERDICDHCATARKRNRYFFVENEETKEFKQVGSTCIKDFLGHANPETIAAWFEALRMLDTFEEYDEADGGGMRNHVVYGLDLAIQCSVELIKTSGFVSRKKAEEQGLESTSGHLASYLYEIGLGKEKAPVVDAVGIVAFKAWFNGQEDRDGSDYVFNVKQTINNESGYIAPRKFGVLAAAVNSWLRHNAEAAVHIPSVYFGAVGDKKVALELTVVNSFGFQGMYAMTYFNIFKDAESRVFVWKTGQSFDKGETVKLVGTIKAHELYNAIQQTIMTRCKVISN